jgi:ketosteroid isomerase-like protein
MGSLLSLSLLGAVLLAHTQAKRIETSAALQSLVETERAFAQTAAREGIRDSFLAYFADDAIALTPEPKPAKQGLQSRPGRPFSELELTWEPRTGDVASSGELGWLTGPSTFIDRTAPAPQPRYGNYLSIWRRQPAGEWRVLIDVGCRVPEPAAFAPGFVPLSLPQRWTGGDPARATEALTAADHSLNAALAHDGVANAYAHVLADAARLHRQTHIPRTSRLAIVAWLEQQRVRKISARSGSVATAASGDLGYSYGRYESSEEPVEHGAYLRVWARDAAGRWWLMVDVTEPAG